MVVNFNMNKKFCIDSEDVVKSAINRANKTKNDYEVGDFTILLFSNYLLEYIKKETNMRPDEWLAPYHPYASNQIFKGNFDGISISAIIPPMGASPIASTAEDLITCGTKVILLVCGAWGIAKNVKLLDFLIPSHAVGPDGTSIYYGRKFNESTIINNDIVNTFVKETKKRTNDFHVGKNFSIEAFYKLERKKVEELKDNKFISIENGELNILATICNQKEVKFGAIFYSYYNPLEGWRIPWIEEQYKNCVHIEGEIALATLEKIIS